MASVVLHSPSVVIGELGGHKPGSFHRSSNCSSEKAPVGSVAYVRCNLAVYEAAINTAAAAGAQLLVMPEAYALQGLVDDSYFEPLISVHGEFPCSKSGVFVQSTLSCFAARYKLAIAFNLFAVRGGNKRITEIVYGSDGELVATYDKHHLFPSETKYVTAGPFQPTSFELFGRRWGIIICYEGVYPFISRDFSQMDGLVNQTARSWIWSIGSTVPIQTSLNSYAKRYPRVMIAATQDYTVVILLAPKIVAVVYKVDSPAS